MPVLHRLFFALLPPLALRPLIAGEGARVGPLRSVVAQDRLHVTLGITADFAELREGLVRLMLRIGDGLRVGPAAVMFDRLVASPGLAALRPSRTSKGLAALAGEIAAPVGRSGLLRPGYRCSPHLTLGYRDGPAFARPVEPIAWRADELVLVHSHVGATRHDVVGRWPLSSRQGELFG